MIALRLRTPDIHIIRCSLNAMGRIPESSALRLEDIGEHDLLSDHLKHWRGTSLELVRCVGANDGFLDMLGAVNQFTGAPQLDKLTLRDCENWTVEALRRLVEKRNKNVPESAGRWTGKPAISEIVVCGTGPAADAADVPPACILPST
ncbi:hypothetical protein DXG03_005501 [Asterophora parasitica]|uniref:Uncharacterized protein n=1 Tax=Asterophora parasitica TaxID=117018 RepID=A0A9P7G9X7_9AGAR|nr:hypothetical protein DXG03_005501 [Asterophora parasitica]